MNKWVMRNRISIGDSIDDSIDDFIDDSIVDSIDDSIDDSRTHMFHIILSTFGAAMARHGLILSQDEAKSLRKVF